MAEFDGCQFLTAPKQSESISSWKFFKKNEGLKLMAMYSSINAIERTPHDSSVGELLEHNHYLWLMKSG